MFSQLRLSCIDQYDVDDNGDEKQVFSNVQASGSYGDSRIQFLQEKKTYKRSVQILMSPIN